jgi:ABC-type nitrate/sulfonate/bicarbonate transport system substrate-binding protein
MIRRALHLALVGLALVACAREQDNGKPPERRKVRVAMVPYLAYVPLNIAQEEGYFAQQGLDVEFVSLTKAMDAVPALLRGSIDVLPAPPVPGIFNAMARGDSVRIVADKGFLDPGGCADIALVSRNGLPGPGASPRLGRVAVEGEVPMFYIVVKALERAGVSIDTLERLDLPHAAKMDALGKGTIDVALAGEPWLSRVIQGHKGSLWMRGADALPAFQYSYIFFGPTLLRDRDAGARFMVAFRRGIARYREGKTPRNLEIVAKALNDEPGRVAQTCWPHMRADSRIDVPGLLGFLAWSKQRGYVTTVPDPAAMIDTTFLATTDATLRQPPLH